jgi:hypothetical protein
MLPASFGALLMMLRIVLMAMRLMSEIKLAHHDENAPTETDDFDG